MSSGTSKKSSKEETKEEWNPNANQLTALKKHMLDWFESHQHENFITPRGFQNTYSQYDAYTNESFRRYFYPIKMKIKNGEILMRNYNSILFNFHSHKNYIKSNPQMLD